MTPSEAYWFAFDNPDCDIKKYQEIACKAPNIAYLFARFIPRANIEYCYKTTNSRGKKDIKSFILNYL